MCQPRPEEERELVERHVERVILTPEHIYVCLRRSREGPAGAQAECVQTHRESDEPVGAGAATITIAWSRPVPSGRKAAIVHVPAHNTPVTPSRRETLLIAIAKARKWMDDLAHGRVASFAVIARQEGKIERHVRLLAPLAFLSPRMVSDLLDGTAPAHLTVRTLARALPYSWAEQESRLMTSGTSRAIASRRIPLD
jgi:hypothetical protein